MRQLRALLVHRGQWYRYQRIDGGFAYPTPEFEAAHRAVDKTFQLDLHECRDYDLVWWDDGKHRGRTHYFTPLRGPERPVPVVAHFLYPTLTEGHFQARYERGRNNADMVLLDHGDLALWRDVGVPVAYCPYSVNEHYYCPPADGQKGVDVCFPGVWAYSPERRALDAWLSRHCEARGWTYQTTGGVDIGMAYRELLADSKVVVHLARTPQTRPPRLLDASACGAAVLASRVPPVPGEDWTDGERYVAFDAPQAYYHSAPHEDSPTYIDADCAQIAAGLDWLLGEGHWVEVAAAARAYVLTEHIWAVRSRQLRETLKEGLGL